MDLIYRGSVKDLLGPVKAGPTDAVVFDYSDAYSVFDWGRMPDALPRKGEALATLAADLFEKLEKPEFWRDFSKSAEALGLRKGNRFGAAFNEVGETLQGEGLRTHYLGVLPHVPQLRTQTQAVIQPRLLSQLKSTARQVVVRQVSVVKPASVTVMGRQLPDYSPTHAAPAPKLIPLEVVFRFSCPSGSSLLERVSRDPSYLASLGYPGLSVSAGASWEFPVLELFTKLESSDRVLTLNEALSIAGITGAQLQDMLFKTAWVAGFLRWLTRQAGAELADGKLEWGISEAGEVFLVDAIGPDELRITCDGVQLSKELLRSLYRGTRWYECVIQAKEQARAQGVAEWKRLVSEQPPVLTPDQKELATQVYLSLANALTGRTWFDLGWKLDRLVSEMKKQGVGGV
jgi:phosphoribosylaminoimidazole-succinocarboxamide synthase